MFDPILTLIMDSFSCQPLNTQFLYLKMLSKVLDYAEMRHIAMTLLKHNNDFTCLPTCYCSIFVFPTGWYRVCGIFSHKAMTVETSILCAR